MMNLEQQRISSLQLIVLIFMFLFGSAGLTAPGQGADNNTWLATIAGLLEALIIIWIFMHLVKKYPGKTLVEINETVFGMYLGKLISAAYLLYFLTMSAWVVRNAGDFFNIVLPLTPRAIFIISFLLICAYAAKNGLEALSNISIILLVLFVLEIIGTLILLPPDMDLSNLLPILDISSKTFFKASHQAASYPFGETLAFLMVFAFLKKREKAQFSIMSACLLGCILWVIIGIRNITVLGPTIGFKILPSFSTVRMIDVASVFTRLEIFLTLNFLSGVFIYTAYNYYAIALGTAQIFHLKTYLPLIFPIGILYFVYSIDMFASIDQSIVYAVDTYPYFAMFFQLLLPVLTLLVIAIRKLPSENKEGTC